MSDDIKPVYWLGWNPENGGDYIVYGKEPSEYQRNRYETDPLYDQATVESLQAKVKELEVAQVESCRELNAKFDECYQLRAKVAEFEKHIQSMDTDAVSVGKIVHKQHEEIKQLNAKLSVLETYIENLPAGTRGATAILMKGDEK